MVMPTLSPLTGLVGEDGITTAVEEVGAEYFAFRKHAAGGYSVNPGTATNVPLTGEAELPLLLMMV